MIIESEFRHLLTELIKLDQKISLQLPAQLAAIRLQKRQLLEAKQTLAALEATVAERYGRGGIAAVRDCYQRLTRYIKRIDRRFSNLLLLAEEYGTDPAGTIACLQIVEQEHQRLVARDLRQEKLSQPAKAAVSAQ